jgi:hypothetical protein
VEDDDNSDRIDGEISDVENDLDSLYGETGQCSCASFHILTMENNKTCGVI